MTNKTILINLTAPPGSGKSTCASLVFGKLKSRGVTCELVGEYAKQITYQKNYKLLENQLYISAKQFKMVSDVASYGVPLIITDSPILLGKYYGQKLPYYKEYSAILDNLYSQFDNFNVFINRVKNYNNSGRIQNEQESDAIGFWLKENLPIDFEINGDEAGANQLVEEIERKFLNV